MTETEAVQTEEMVEMAEETSNLKEQLLELCSGIPDELPDHPGLDQRFKT